ncbi:unnamed protein product [Euphydryas editha]|uniref:FLYWCH-type domain-containing protein n=1 Tax=Euphydryas editha TaxID=104508 RepID=A0AAU9TM37_EUPED|nr:unnamed protein product [Euphydryas editha]
MFAKAQAELNRELVQSLLATSPVNVAPLSSSSLATVKHGNFARCTARFNGACRDSENLEAFIDAMMYQCKCISDEHALRGLPMLIEGEAAVWYRGIKSSVTSWEDVLNKLREYVPEFIVSKKGKRMLVLDNQRFYATPKFVPEFIVSNKGKRMLVLNKQRFYATPSKYSKVRWRCSHYGCRATVMTVDDEVVNYNDKHNHK